MYVSSDGALFVVDRDGGRLQRIGARPSRPSRRSSDDGHTEEPGGGLEESPRRERARPRRSWTPRRGNLVRSGSVGSCSRVAVAHGTACPPTPCRAETSRPVLEPCRSPTPSALRRRTRRCIVGLTVRLKIHRVSSPRPGHSETTRRAVMGTLDKARYRASPSAGSGCYGARVYRAMSERDRRRGGGVA